jgi:hypothetical protein
VKRRPFEPVTLPVDPPASRTNRTTKSVYVKRKPAKPSTKSANSAGVSVNSMRSLVDSAALPLERKARSLVAKMLPVDWARRPGDRVRRSRVPPTLPMFFEALTLWVPATEATQTTQTTVEATFAGAAER